jgi:hypothetical protein
MGKTDPTFAERLKLNRMKPPALPVPQPQMAMRPTK